MKKNIEYNDKDMVSSHRQLMIILQNLDNSGVDENTKNLLREQIIQDLDLLEKGEELIQKAFKNGMEQGRKIGKIESEIIAEILLVKNALSWNISKENLVPQLKYLKYKLDSNLQYIREHSDDADSKIYEDLKLIGNLTDPDIYES